MDAQTWLGEKEVESKHYLLEDVYKLKEGDWIYIIKSDGVSGYYKVYDLTEKLLMTFTGKKTNIFPWNKYGETWKAYRNKEMADLGISITLPCSLKGLVYVFLRKGKNKVGKPIYRMVKGRVSSFEISSTGLFLKVLFGKKIHRKRVEDLLITDEQIMNRVSELIKADCIIMGLPEKYRFLLNK